MIKTFLHIVEKINTDFKENIVKTSIIVLIMVTTYLLSENIFLSFVVGTAAAVLFLNWDSRVFIGVGLVFLMFTPLIVAFGKKAVAGQMAIYAYYMLALGVILLILEHCKQYFLESDISEKIESIKFGSGNNKKFLIIASAVMAILLAMSGPFLFSSRSNIQNNPGAQNGALSAELINQLGGINSIMEKLAIDQQKSSGGVAIATASAATAKAEPKSAKDADWETTKVLIDNASGKDGLEEKLADKFRKFGKSNVYTTKTMSALSEKTLIQRCAGCSGIVIKLLSVMDNFEEARLVEDPELTDEIRITLGADQIGIANGDIAISVLNGSKTSGVARQLGNAMSRDGFNLVSIGNTSRKDYEKTIIKYAPANIKKADAVKKYLKGTYSNLEILEDPSLTPAVDAEIIIGQNQ